MQPYLIGDHVFYARSFFEATVAAIDRARALFRTGDAAAGNALFQAAVAIRRRAEQQAPRPSRPRVSLRDASRFNRAARA
jgi:hypothetical protein